MPTESPAAPDVRTPEAEGDRTSGELIAAAAKGESLTGPEQMEALDWLLSDDPADDGDVTHTLELNVGSPNKEQWIRWTIQPVDIDLLRLIQREAAGNRAQRRSGGGADATQANLRIVVEGTAAPAVAEATQQHNRAANDKGRAQLSPEQFIAWRFRKKPGLVGQIAGEIMDLSGFNDEDVRDAREVQAAGN